MSVFFTEIQDRKKQLQCLNLLVLVLPDIHRATLKVRREEYVCEDWQEIDTIPANHSDFGGIFPIF